MSRSHAFRSIAAALALALAGAAEAQLSTATIKGQITSGADAAPAGLAVVAVNKGSGFSYKAQTRAGGSYAITSLPPGEYEIRITGPDGTTKTDTLSLAVGETASVNLALGATKVEEITVTAPQRKGVKNSEVGTTVALRMIETMPSPTNNFLANADLAPGVTFSQEQSSGFTKIQSGAQSANNVNVFVDGVSQKNQILKGGVTGQDTSRGNPFPQSAVSQYKVITSNYKAEFEQVSSAAITAITKSGTNELHGGAYLDRTETGWRAKSPFEVKREQAGQPLLGSAKTEGGLSIGGAITEDKLHYFLAYDIKDINDSRQVLPKNLNRFDSAALNGPNSLVPFFASKAGTYVDPFTEHLVFGKLNAALDDDKKLTVSAKLRFEKDRVPENRELSSASNFKNRTNDEVRVDAIHEWSLRGGALLAETRAGYQTATWSPKTASSEPFIRYRVPSVNAGDVNFWWAGPEILLDGGSPDMQKKTQKGLTLAQDMTYTGAANHVFKGGGKVTFMKYDLSGTDRAVPVIDTLINLADGTSYYDPATGACVAGADTRCNVQPALAATSTSLNNAQIGLFVQDDWAVTKKLEVNLGVRWDVETNMLNNSYVTPADRVAALLGPDTRNINGATTTQTYAQSLARGGVKIADYISTGSSRKAYLGAIAPRLGASFDVLGDKRTVLFAGAGRSYDRTIADHALSEKHKNLQAGGEIWMIRNDVKLPYTDQVSAGIRQAAGPVNLEATLAYMRGENQFQWFGGNRDFNGGFNGANLITPFWGGPAGFGTLILGDFVGKTKSTSVMLKAEKPYSKASGWMASLAYTYTDAQTTHNDWNDDMFDWTAARAGRTFHPSMLADKHRIVAAAMADNLIPWGFVVAAKWTWASGVPRRGWRDPSGAFPEGELFAVWNQPKLSQLDLGVAKVFKSGNGDFTFKADLLNVFNTTNYYRDQNAWGGANNDYQGIRGPTRTLKFSGSYSF